MEKTYTTRQIADMLGVDPRTVVRWIRRDELEAYPLSPIPRSPLRITQAALDDFLARRDAAAKNPK